MYNKKILSTLFLGAAVLFLSGCWSKDATQEKNGAKNNADISSSQNISNLPEPTGKADDTFNSIIDGANQESSQITSDENDARSAIADESQVIDDLDKEL